MGGVLFAQPKYQPKYLRQDDKAFNDLTIRTDNFGWIEFKKTARVNPNSFFKDFATNLGLGQHYDFKSTKDETDKQYMRHQRFQLFYKNTPIEGVEYLLHSSPDGILTLAQGRIPENMDFDVTKSMPEPKALDIALSNMKVTLADLKKLERKKPDGTLLFARMGDEAVNVNFKLCWVFDVYGNEILNAFMVYIDANSGEVVKKISLLRNCFGHDHSSPRANTKTSIVEPVSVVTAPLVASTFTPLDRYLNAPSGLGFETEVDDSNTSRNRLSAFNNTLNTRMAVNVNGVNVSDWELLLDVFNVAGNINQNNPSNWTENVASRNAQTAHWLTQRMHQMMQQSVGRNGLNGQGLYPGVVTNWSAQNAQWRKGKNQLRFGNIGGASMVAADVLGHEYMHGVNENTAGLAYEGESGALDEGIADIFGTALERNIMVNPQSSTNLNGWNWLCGEDFFTIRNMAIPAQFNQPSTYLGNSWFPINGPCVDGNDYCGVHTNSGVLNRWFNSIATGNRLNGNMVTPISFDKSLQIVYRALTVYMWSSAGYADMRNATIQATKDLNNGNSCAAEILAVHNAWWDANVTGATPCINSCDFNLTASSFNPNPACGSAFTLNAACSGNNCAGVSYTWTGQGGVRYGQQANYTAPTSNGSYTYSLTASRSGCSDKTANVTVNVTNCGGISNSCAGGNFGGHFDTGNCDIFNGWALDHSNYGRTLDVDIFVDGVKVATVSANQNRPDLGAAFGNAAANLHGWSYNVPANASWRNSTNRTVTARICGASNDLNNSPKTVNCTGGTPPTPTPTPVTCAGGNFNGHFDTGNCGVFNGWALDQSNYGRTVDVEIRVDGVLVATVQANKSRPDLVGAFGTAAAEMHGWWYYPSASASWRNGTKTVSARICGATSDLYNSPKTVNFSNCRVGVEEKEAFAVRRSDSSEGFLSDLNDGNDLILSPNPTNGELRFQIGLPSKTDVLVSLSDLSGRILQTKTYKNREGQLDEKLDLGTLPNGSYVFSLKTTQTDESAKLFSRKVMVLR